MLAHARTGDFPAVVRIDKLTDSQLLSTGNVAHSPLHGFAKIMAPNSSSSSSDTAPVRKARKAVLPAAGLGTRFLPATKAQPKEMLAVVDKPQIQYVAAECVASGIKHIIIVTGKCKNSIEDH